MRPHNNDTYEWKQIRKRILARDGGVCAECGSDEEIQVDHIIPASKGGGDEEDNLQLLCGLHNRLKSNKTGRQRVTWYDAEFFN